MRCWCLLLVMVVMEVMADGFPPSGDQGHKQSRRHLESSKAAFLKPSVRLSTVKGINLPGFPLDLPSTTAVPCPVPCCEIHNPVCGSDDFTYENPCFLEDKRLCDKEVGLTTEYCGRCGSPVPAEKCCPFNCPTKEVFVCGNDGKTYDSPCSLEEERICNDKPDLRLVRYKKCD